METSPFTISWPPKSDTNSNASDESYKYPDDKLENDVPLNVENINEGVPDSELQRDHFQGSDDAANEQESNGNDNNDEDDYALVISTNSISIQSTNITNDSASSNNEMDIDMISTRDDDNQRNWNLPLTANTGCVLASL